MPAAAPPRPGKRRRHLWRSSGPWLAVGVAALAVLAWLLLPDGAAAPEAPLITLRRWLTDRGVDLTALVVTGEGSDVRGLAAARHLVPGETVATLPLALTLNAATFSGAKWLQNATQPDGSLVEEDPLLYCLSTLVVLYDRLLPNSAWRAYLASLPSSFDLPALFDARRPNGEPRLWTYLGVLRTLVVQQQTEMATLLPFVRRAVGRLPGGAAALSSLTDDAFRDLAAWAWCIARTRMLDQPVDSFPGAWLPPGARKLPVLMPFLDLLNHAEPGEANVALTSDNKMLTLSALRAVAVGEELRFSYRDIVAEVEADPSLRDELCGEQMLSHYGFIVRGGQPHRDCWQLDLSLEAMEAALGRGSSAGAAQRLAAASIAENVSTIVDGTITLWSGLLRWCIAAAGLSPAGKPEEDADAWRLLYLIIDAQRKVLEARLLEAERRAEPSGGDGPAVRALAASALRVAAAAADAAGRQAIALTPSA